MIVRILSRIHVTIVSEKMRIKNYKVMYTNTDSLCNIECNDVYDLMKRNIRFATSDYAINNTYGILFVNKKSVWLNERR